MTMKLYFITFLVAFLEAEANVDVSGEISFNIHEPRREEEQRSEERDQQEVYMKAVAVDESETKTTVMSTIKNERNSTVAAIVECQYEFPEEPQVEALLSNMMNQLTKMFVKAQDMLPSKESQDNTVRSLRRRGEKRFRVISTKKTQFFEEIYNNMTKQYREFYNTTTVTVDRSGKQNDPCKIQEQIKQLWKELLDSSLTTFRQAALTCIDENLRTLGDGDHSKTRAKMSQYLLRELAKVRVNQMLMLCDKFQLCYPELLRKQMPGRVLSEHEPDYE